MEWSTQLTRFNWQAIDTVLLDMDGTLLDLAFDNHFWLELVPSVYAEKYQLSKTEAKANLDELYQSYHGTLEWYCIEFWSKKLGLDIVKIKQQVADKVEYRKGILKFLEATKQQNKKLYLVTNAHPETLAIKLKIQNFTDYFDELLTSHQTGYPKEDIRFWKRIEELWKFDKQRTLFVDDSDSILKKAKEFGIGHIRGVSNPDSTRSTQTFNDFESINQLDEILAL